ncbi:MAG: glycosyltransferase family 9 protein [Candidatus Omnitrophica bacterium]|nr:glycosyltransferase family 9 protein [Candidatus Omnitrophota bacterium]
MKFIGIGSITLASSMIINIRNKYKDTKIYFLTFRDNKEILDILSLADKVLIIDYRNPFLLLKTIIGSLLFCYKERIDIVLDIEFYSKFSTIMSFLSGARWRVGFYLARYWRNSLINIPIYFNNSRHILEIYSMFSKALLVDNQNLYPKEIKISDQEKTELLTILKEYNILDLNKFIAFNIHASDLALCRRWPLKHFVSLIELFFSENKDINIILTGAKREVSYSQEFLEILPQQYRQRVINLTGKLALKQFLTLLAHIPLFVTNDTGPFHLAKAVGARTISLWGPGSIDLYGPFGKEKEVQDVIYKRYSCSPCLYVYRTNAGYFCEGKAPCMEEIQPEEVLDLMRQRLNQRIS